MAQAAGTEARSRGVADVVTFLASRRGKVDFIGGFAETLRRVLRDELEE